MHRAYCKNCDLSKNQIVINSKEEVHHIKGNLEIELINDPKITIHYWCPNTCYVDITYNNGKSDTFTYRLNTGDPLEHLGNPSCQNHIANPCPST